MAILLLTNGIGESKVSTEELLQNLKPNEPSIKIAEILVDNISYELDFIIFPSDLEPIRSRTDIDGVEPDRGGPSGYLSGARA